jgi:membrane-bound lytic murein transglycosylase
MMDRGQVSNQKKTSMGALEHLAEKKEEQVSEILKRRVMWT